MSAIVENQSGLPEQLQRHLALRVQRVGNRYDYFLQNGWDINGLASMHEECALLSDLAAPQSSLQNLHTALHQLHQQLDVLLLQQTLPDGAINEQLNRSVHDIKLLIPALPEPQTQQTPQRSDEHHAHLETPPEAYWKRWTSTTIAPVLVDTNIAAKQVEEEPELDPWGNNAQIYGKRVNISSPVAAKPAAAQASSAPPAEPARRALGTLTPTPKPRVEVDNTTAAKPAAIKPLAPIKPVSAAIELKVPEGARLYHLTDSSNLSLELDQRLESQGFELEVLDDANELIELLTTIAPDLVVVDASYSDVMERIGDSIRQVRERSNKRISLIALAENDDIPLRLSARRAGVDALIIQPNSVQDVLVRLQQLLDPHQEAPYRILIVEDDRSQALFAEGILRNAGMQSMVILDALEVISALQQFSPDLILMDLHMPAANGIELTALIRERAEFVSTPIVFLSGESDQERQFDALEAGGDDFLSKPIRPRHLISAVQNRVRRHRTLTQQQQSAATATALAIKDEQGTLYTRNAMLQKIDEILANNTAQLGGVLYMDIEAASTLRDRVGLSAYETIINQVGERLAQQSPSDWVCRFGDSSFVVVNFDRDEIGLEAQASAMRGGLMQHSFEHDGKSLRLRTCVGLASFAYHFADHKQLLNVTERCSREARTSDRGLRRYEPPKASHAEQEAHLLHIISKAVSNQELELVYQPIVAVAGGDESQFQVLLRMRDHEGRMISAGDIIPMAERGDFILDIDRWVIIQALKVIQDRQQGEKPLRLFVPQSAFTLAEPSQAQWLVAELENHGVPATSLIIEIRAQDALVHHQPVQKFCADLTPDGVQFCLSQFEAGAENEALLERLSLGYVKLALKYTTNNNQNNVRDEMKALVDRAHRRGLEVIGSGVEDPQAAATLWISGIDFIQGNLVQQADQRLEFDFQQAVL